VTVGPLNHVYYWTTNMNRAVEFYEKVLGLALLRREGDSWAEFDSGSVHFALHGEVEEHALAPGVGGTAVFEVTDLDAARRGLEEKGVRFDEHVGEVAGYARFASFPDPDGNTVQIIEYLRGR
jgi:catechol 2,3-dioxygenase-like lactoylglutathione lyase family enzyme